MQQLSRFISKFLTSISRRVPHGQSLVETAIALPILILMMLGVFEVGWALRGYLTLVNMDREATRFAVRGVYLDFDSQAMKSNSVCAFDTARDPFGVGYCKVISHATQSLAGQLAADYGNSTGNASIIVTYYDIAPDPNFNCLGDSDCFTGASNNVPFDCTRFSNKSHPSGYISGENLASVQYPILSVKYDSALDGSPNKPAFYDKNFAITNTTALTKYAYHTGGPYFSRINPKDQVEKLRGAVNQLNCQLTQKKLSTVGDNVIIVETSYNQEMLVGLPLITAFVPNPVPLYSHTAMRLTTDLRDTEQAQACQLVPVIFPYSAFSGGVSPGVEVFREFANGNEAGNFGLLSWDPGSGTTSTGELEANLLDPSRASKVYKEPPGTSPVDNILNIGDYINGSTGVFGNSIEDELDKLKTYSRLYFPVWNDSNCTGSGGNRNCGTEQSGTGSNAKYKVSTYLVAQVTGYQTTGNPKGLTIRFIGFDQNVCQCNPETDGPACDPP
ncbi:MAG: hypothetical protein FOGNACKC_02363 [Anaerolineae bacterium]|nr:hypothetical protein [Anaerolineae bacterium]